MTAAFNPQLPGRRPRCGDGRVVRLEVRDGLKPGDRRGESRRVHLPGDARAAARAGRLSRPDALRLAWLELRDFRNHEHTRLEDIPEGLIVVVGPNGEGKTNLLEGMRSCSSLSVASDVVVASPSCAEGADAAYARGEVETLDGRVLVEIEIPEPRREPRPGEPLDRPAQARLCGARCGPCCFGPDDLADRDRRSVEAPRRSWTSAIARSGR